MRLPTPPVPVPLPQISPGGEIKSWEQVADFRIYNTRSFWLFEEDGGNRVVFDMDGLARNVGLEASMRKRGYLPAAHIVTARDPGKRQFRVVDGHNRLAIARELNLPVWFAVHPEDHHISPLEYSVSQKSWSFVDRAKAHASLDDYSEVLAYCKETGVPERAAFNIFRGEVAANTNNRVAIEAGTYEIRDRVMPAKIHFAIQQAGKPFAKSLSFVCALSKVYLYSQDAFETLVVNFAKYRVQLEERKTTEAYLDHFGRIFNFNRRGGPVPFKTEIDRCMLERQRHFGKKTT